MVEFYEKEIKSNWTKEEIKWFKDFNKLLIMGFKPKSFTVSKEYYNKVERERYYYRNDFYNNLSKSSIYTTSEKFLIAK